MEHLLFLLVLLLPGAAGNQSEKQDIIFLVDTSWRMPRVMTKVRISLMRVLSSLRPRYGLIQYDQELKTIWHLNTSMGLRSQLNAVKRMRPMRPGPPRLGAALMHVLRSEFKPTAGARPCAKKRALALTSGHSEDDIEFPLQHLRDSDIDVLLIDMTTGQDHLRLANATGFSSAESLRNMETETCSRCFESVRLVAGSSLCSGRLEVKNQSEQTWSSVCEAAFDQQDAEVVCRQLGCGPPSGLQGALSVGVETPMWSREFQCGGHESALRDCKSSAGGSCSAGRAAGLTCSDSALLSEPVRLVGGPSRCAGSLQLRRRGWRPVAGPQWSLREASLVCVLLDCGSAVSVGETLNSSNRSVWWISSHCALAGFPLTECASADSPSSTLEISCSESVRLVAGSSLCSGRLEVKNQSEQTWSSVCEAAFDQQDAEVVCRQLGCGPPSGLQGTLSVGVETPMWSREFQCGGHESALRDCRSSAGGSCSAGRAAGLTCSEPVRLVGGPSRCDGTLQLKQGAWRPVAGTDWTQAEVAAACRQLDCGSAVSGSGKPGPDRPAWGLRAGCARSGSSLRECASPSRSSSTVRLVCSDLLVEPVIWVSSESGVYWPPQQGAAAVLLGSSFSISCSIQPQYPGGSFHLSFSSPSATRLLSQSAANHSAHFLFAAAEPDHQGSYRCAYWLHMFSRNFSSQSPQMSLSVSDPTAFGIRLLFLLVFLSAVCTIYKVLRRHSSAHQQDIRMDLSNQGSRTGSAEPREQNRGSRTREAEPEPQNWHSIIEAAKQGSRTGVAEPGKQKRSSRTRTAGPRKQNQGNRTGEAELEQQNCGSRTGEAEPEQAAAWL
ncbi:uncharacterized protein ACNS7B_015231 [Menidia menidia]